MVKIYIDPGHDINTPGKRALDGSMREFEFNKAVALQLAKILGEYDNVELLFSHPLDDGIDQSLEHRVNLAKKWGAELFLSIHANAGATTARGIETYIDDEAGDAVYHIARSIHDQTIVATDNKNRGIKRSNFYVLDKFKGKSVLIECGFMTNAEDLALLNSTTYRNKCAEGMAKGIIAHYGLQRKYLKPSETPNHQYRVIAGTFNNEVNAINLSKELQARGFTSFVEKKN